MCYVDYLVNYVASVFVPSDLDLNCSFLFDLLVDFSCVFPLRCSCAFSFHHIVACFFLFCISWHLDCSSFIFSFCSWQNLCKQVYPYYCQCERTPTTNLAFLFYGYQCTGLLSSCWDHSKYSISFSWISNLFLTCFDSWSIGVNSICSHASCPYLMQAHFWSCTW